MTKKILVIANIIVAATCFAWLCSEFLAPALASHIYKNEYKDLVFQCDHVMREHFIAKQMVLSQPSEKTANNLEAAEIGLTACHSYDKTRKTMIAWGVSENQLARIGLEAIEDKAIEVREFVRTHEIRY